MSKVASLFSKLAFLEKQFCSADRTVDFSGAFQFSFLNSFSSFECYFFVCQPGGLNSERMAPAAAVLLLKSCFETEFGRCGGRENEKDLKSVASSEELLKQNVFAVSQTVALSKVWEEIVSPSQSVGSSRRKGLCSRSREHLLLVISKTVDRP